MKKNEDIKLGKSDFEKMWEVANVFVFENDTGFILPMMSSVPKVTGFKEKNFVFFCENGKGQAYHEKTEIKNAKKQGLTNFLAPKYLKDYFLESNKIINKMSKFFREISNKNLKNISNEALKSLFEESNSLIIDIFGYYYAFQPHYVGSIEEYMKNELTKYVSKNKLNEVYGVLTKSERISKLMEEEGAWLNLVLSSKERGIKSSSEYLIKLFNAHYKKYFIVYSADVVTKDKSTKNFLFDKWKDYIEYSKDELLKKLNDIKSYSNRIREEKREIIKKHSIPKFLYKKFSDLAEIGQIRLNLRIEGWMPAYFYNREILDEIACRYDYSLGDLRWFTYNEILSLFGGNKIKRGSIGRRKKAFLRIVEEDQPRLLEGISGKNEFERLIEPQDFRSIVEITGQSVMKGKLTGEVVLFNWGDNIEEKSEIMKKNKSVLVAGQTRPELMPLIRQASAIITDEGGIMSHASIISRELGIPCIVGIGNATEVLKDGDLVEVDANHGIVRILKKSKSFTSRK